MVEKRIVDHTTSELHKIAENELTELENQLQHIIYWDDHDYFKNMKTSAFLISIYKL